MTTAVREVVAYLVEVFVIEAGAFVVVTVRIVVYNTLSTGLAVACV